ncbi:SAM-dependent methyltransferase [Nonomuraea fuscirosea]|uniref:SAM-dependent methyltransferase n=1 Tax=Nonomuraea fuscirosea TaxID=1291556 RepID=UPI00342F243B
MNPDQIIAQAREVLDCTQPIAVMFMGVLGYVKDLQVMHSIIDRVMQAVPSGSYLVLWDGTATGEAMSAGNDRLAEGGAVPYYLLSLAELAECFAGLDLVEPGMRAVRRLGRAGCSSVTRPSCPVMALWSARVIVTVSTVPSRPASQQKVSSVSCITAV